MKRAWGMLAIAGATAIACSSSVTGTGSSSSSSSGASGTASSSGASSGGGGRCMLIYADACQAQLEASCCAPSATCRDDSECFALVPCVRTCKHDTSCETNCYSDHSSGVGDFDTLLNCIASNLGPSCQIL